MRKLLIADDDERLRGFVSEWLEHENFIVDSAADGEECREYLLQSEYDVLIIDWDMPKLSGVELCRWFRSKGGTTPILMLTGKDHIDEKEAGYAVGVDDYFTKPFEVRELAARVRALLRRNQPVVSSIMTIGNLTIDPEAHTVSIGSEQVNLTSTEFRALEFLGRHPNQIFSAEVLLSRVWNDATSDITPDAVRACLGRLREKFESAGYPSLIENMNKLGYRLNLQIFC